MLYLALYQAVFLKAKAAKINSFLFRCNLGNLKLNYYYPSAITEAEKQLGLTKKQGSTTAYQVLLPINHLKRGKFWGVAYSFRITDIRIEDMINLDEMGEYPEDTNRLIGKLPTFL